MSSLLNSFRYLLKRLFGSTMRITTPIRQTDRVFAGYLTWNGEEWWDSRDRNYLDSLFWTGDPEEWWRLYDFMLWQRDQSRRFSEIRKRSRVKGEQNEAESPRYKRQRLDVESSSKGLMLPPSSLPLPQWKLDGIVQDSQDSDAPPLSFGLQRWKLDGIVHDSQEEDSDDEM
ncbi:hypothetical protein BJ508DRAFT_316166 [Ascobolus immersus RN42]|uniref:Uncharacterized protein n=1 Tax=Ascobolus immersus RN42 TaxID=1160509 RepID=A0A3N4H7I2_ASCIM|nr:hypothetical protein BJ508DRAFT_316166 [Ascobolus immersus RN42]